MKIVVAGAGEVGFHIASSLIKDGKDVVLVEKNPARAKYASSHLDCLVVVGEATNPDILKEAGIDNADAFISATDYDEVNMITCFIVASEFDVPVKIARVRNVSYSKRRMQGKALAGVDYVVNPEIEAAKTIVSTVQHGATSDIFLFEDLNIQLRDIIVDEDAFFCGKTLKDIKRDLKEEFLIAGIMRDDEIVIPDGDTVILDKDHIYLVASSRSFVRMLKKVGMHGKKLKSIVILGGGNIGHHVAEMLLQQGKSIKIIDKDYEICKTLTADFPNALVLNADVSDESIFEDEQLFNCDAIICTTHNEELNILAAIYGKSKGIKRAVALVNKSNYITISDDLGIDSTVSPKISSVNAILKYIRKGNIKSVMKVLNGMAEVAEFFVAHGAEVTTKTLKDIKLPKGSLVVAVARNNRTFIPDGNFVMQSGDIALTFSADNTAESLQPYFSE
ncbi:MAG: Trk system potassium transporter TrkA [Deferribacterales bacterium]